MKEQSYWTKPDHSEIAFVMPISEGNYHYKIVVRKKGSTAIKKLIKRNMGRYNAQKVLNELARKMNWEPAYTRR